MKWIQTKDRLPKHAGQYKVKTNNGESIAFYTQNIYGHWGWLCVNETYKVFEWQEE